MLFSVILCLAAVFHREWVSMRSVATGELKLTLIQLNGQQAAIESSTPLHKPKPPEDWESIAFPVKARRIGEVAKGSRIQFSFPVFNPLSSDMVIDSVTSSCGCTTVTHSHIVIPPGETELISGEVDTLAYRGRRVAILTVRLAAPFLYEQRLRVEAFIRQDLVFFPDSVVFEGVFAGETHQRTTTLMHAGTPKLRIAKITSDQPWLTVTHRETFTAAEKSNHEIAVNVGEDAPPGLLQQQVLIHLHAPEKTTIPLLVTGEVLDQITISPRSIHLGTLTKNQTEQINLIVRAREAIEITSIGSDQWDLQYKPTTSKKKIHLIPLKLTPRKPGRLTSTSELVIQAFGTQQYTAKTVITATLPNP